MDVEVEGCVLGQTCVVEVDEVVDVRQHVVFEVVVMVETASMVLEIVAGKTANEAAVSHVRLCAPLNQRQDITASKLIITEVFE